MSDDHYWLSGILQWSWWIGLIGYRFGVTGDNLLNWPALMMMMMMVEGNFWNKRPAT